MMKLHSFLLLIAFLTVQAAAAQDTIPLTAAEVSSLYRTQSRSWVSVHDPSVVHTTGQTFYAVGSHNGFARSTDNMVNWTGVSNNYYGRITASGTVSRCGYADAYSTHAVRRVTVLVDGQPTEVDFGNFDAKAWAHGDQANWTIDGVMWAPDLIWNPYLEKWCMYMSINGDNWHSLVVMLAADAITGPYVYQGPVVFSGFINNTVPEISYKKTDLELVLGPQQTLPARYNLGSRWGDTYPNNIDPCTFWDEEGELWMAYGSWSGGIFMLKLDKQTGLRDYTVSYPLTYEGTTLKSDPYFGTHVAGGYYVSGEGPYIQHIGDYYYLFMSYGGFAPDGGYEMRVFRSRQPDGPYVDGSGTSALYSKWEFNVGPGATTNRGMKLMGAYNQWGLMTVGECAQGHNSATLDEQGRAFVVYHTKFNDGTFGHQVRTHQLFLNQQGWLCAAPFQFDGETENDDSISRRCAFTPEQIPGTYDVLIHKYRMDHEKMEEVTPIHLTLTAEGRITGDRTGTWRQTEGTGYVRLTFGGVAYDGVLIPQTVDGTTMQAVAFTATSTAGVSVWGYKVLPQYAIAATARDYKVPVTNNQLVSRNLALHGQGSYGATVEWMSSVPAVISPEGFYAPADTATRVSLTCRIAAGNYVYDRTYQVTAQRATEPVGDPLTGLVAYYDFDRKPTVNAYAPEGTAAYYGRLGSGRVPVLAADPARMGQTVHLYQAEQKNASYLRMDNPLLGRTDLDGFTLSCWVLRGSQDLWNGLWTVTDRAASLTASIRQRLFLTGNGYVGFNNGEDYFDANRPNDAGTNPTSFIPVGDWALVTLVVSRADGVSLYVDGARKSHRTFASSAGTATTAAAAARLFDYGKVLDFISVAPYMQLGAGSFWGSAEATFDDLLVYDRPLSQTDVRGLYTLSTRVTDFGPDGAVGIAEIGHGPWTMDNEATAPSGIYDLSGRRTGQGRQKPGLYIVGGRKVVIR